MKYQDKKSLLSPPVAELEALLRCYFGYLPEEEISTFLDDEGNGVAAWEVADDHFRQRAADATSE